MRQHNSLLKIVITVMFFLSSEAVLFAGQLQTDTTKPHTQIQAATIKSSTPANMSGLAIISPKPNELLMAPRTYTINYMAIGVDTIDIDYLVYDVDYQGNPQSTFQTRSILKDKPPTGSCTIQISRDMVPSKHHSGCGTPLSGNTEYYDGIVAIRLSGLLKGTKIERICPLRVKVPKIRLVQPASGSDLYTGQWYEARWSTIGHRQNTVKLHIAKDPPGKFAFSHEWTVEVPNNGRYRFRVPSNLNIDIPAGGRNMYLIVEENFDSSTWEPILLSWKEFKLHGK